MNLPMDKEQDKVGIQLSDLMGSLVTVRIVDAQSTQKNKQDVLIVTCEHKKKQVKFGVISDSAIKSFLNHGRKENNQIQVEIPEKILNESQDGKIQWLNFAY